jgi:hypothetical protein
MRTLRHDFARFTSDDPPLDDDECGWKYIHADVFRFPRHKSVFCALVGAGSQLLGLCAAIFALALAGAPPFLCLLFGRCKLSMWLPPSPHVSVPPHPTGNFPSAIDISMHESTCTFHGSTERM